MFWHRSHFFTNSTWPVSTRNEGVMFYVALRSGWSCSLCVGQHNKDTFIPLNVFHVLINFDNTTTSQTRKRHFAGVLYCVLLLNNNIDTITGHVNYFHNLQHSQNHFMICVKHCRWHNYLYALQIWLALSRPVLHWSEFYILFYRGCAVHKRDEILVSQEQNSLHKCQHLFDKKAELMFVLCHALFNQNSIY